jgi:hypothetical protein
MELASSAFKKTNLILLIIIMTKKTKLVHESLENRQLLANLCTAYYGATATVDLSDTICTPSAAITLDAGNSGFVVKSFELNASPVVANTTDCEFFNTKGYGAKGCAEARTVNLNGELVLTMTTAPSGDTADFTCAIDKKFQWAIDSTRVELKGATWTPAASALDMASPFYTYGTTGTTIFTPGGAAIPTTSAACGDLKINNGKVEVRAIFCEDGSASALEFVSRGGGVVVATALESVLPAATAMNFQCEGTGKLAAGSTALAINAPALGTMRDAATAVAQNIGKAISQDSNTNPDMYSATVKGALFDAWFSYDTDADKTKILA